LNKKLQTLIQENKQHRWNTRLVGFWRRK